MPTMPRNITVTVVVALAVFGLSTSATSAAAPVPQSIRIEALDENGTPLTIDDVNRGEASHGFQPSLRTSSGNVTRWYRIAPPPMSDTPYLIALSEKVRDADLYFPRSDGTYALLRFGMNIPFDLRVYPSIFPAALLTPEMRGAKRLFLRLYGPATPPRIRPQGPFDEFVSALERWTFLFAGFLLSIAISSAFLAIYLRERVFVLQATLMAAAVLFTLVNSGLAWRRVGPNTARSARNAYTA